MDAFTYSTFTAVMALVALVLAIVALVVRFVVPAPTRAGLASPARWLAWLVAATCTVGSLIYSEYFHFPPCLLCWYQRIAMYPMALLLLVAAVRRDRHVRWYTLPMAAVGAGISTYHYVIEWRPSLQSGACGIGPGSCTTIWFRQFGFVTLPFMALCGFVAIFALTLGRDLGGGEPDDADERPDERPEEGP